MKFKVCERPVDNNDYDDLYKALLKAHANGKAIEVSLEGKHHGSVLFALRKRHTDKSTAVGSRRLPESDALIVSIEKNGPSK